jgi:hypothetical protein
MKGSEIKRDIALNLRIMWKLDAALGNLSDGDDVISHRSTHDTANMVMVYFVGYRRCNCSICSGLVSSTATTADIVFPLIAEALGNTPPEQLGPVIDEILAKHLLYRYDDSEEEET